MKQSPAPEVIHFARSSGSVEPRNGFDVNVTEEHAAAGMVSGNPALVALELAAMERNAISVSDALRGNWRDSLLAVLLGNVIYFFLLEPRLPEQIRHQPFQIDRGLLLDFAICLAAFVLLRLLRKS